MDKDSMWVTSTEGIYNISMDYFNDLFTSGVNSNFVDIEHLIPVCITNDMNRELVSKVTDTEILEAWRQMDPRKAFGTDGLSSIFYKNNWEVVGADVLHLCDDILNGNRGASDIIETMVVLIPKIEEPTDMSHYRSISLFRVIYKIIVKVLANRLKLCLNRCITQNQSAFVPKRMIHNNILIAHKMMHYLLNSKNGPNKRFVAKLDMNKAYDRVEWNFHEFVLIKMGFTRGWVSKPMNCVRSVKYWIKCNS